MSEQGAGQQEAAVRVTAAMGFLAAELRTLYGRLADACASNDEALAGDLVVAIVAYQPEWADLSRRLAPRGALPTVLLMGDGRMSC